MNIASTLLTQPGAQDASARLKSNYSYETALSNGGYATDRSYVQKMVAVSRSPLMSEVLRSLGVTEQ